jgi:hypothetical protein
MLSKRILSAGSLALLTYWAWTDGSEEIVRTREV